MPDANQIAARIFAQLLFEVTIVHQRISHPVTSEEPYFRHQFLSIIKLRNRTHCPGE